MSNQHLEITPSNITSTGKLSYKNGQPTIQLLIGAQERSIVPGSIRLCGEFTVMLNEPIIPLPSDNVRMNERLGYSICLFPAVGSDDRNHQPAQSDDEFIPFCNPVSW